MTTRFNTRYIKPVNIQLGDLIRVSWGNQDVKESIMGRVAHREQIGLTEWQTAGGAVLLQRDDAGRCFPADRPGIKVTVALLDRPDPATVVALDGLEK